jgi:sigma-B regulation protein RsbU (phosphoserine phosphatase)
MPFKQLALSTDKEKLSYEIEQAAYRYHVTGLWIAAIFDPLFAITDYLNIPHAWHNIFVLRLMVAVLCIFLLLLRRKYTYPSFIGAYVVFFAISLQNAYTYSLIDVKDFLGHTLNYIALFLGASMFVLWRWYYTVIAVVVSLLACAFFFGNNHKLDFHVALVEGGLLLIVMSVFTIILIQTRYKLTVKTLIAKLALANANQELNNQKELIENKNKHITDSIKYAQRIQNAILPTLDKIHTELPHTFVVFKPKDIVSGDFYYFNQVGNKTVIAAVDCTGHGVPGAFMSMIGYEILNEITNVQDVVIANEILYSLNLNIRKSLKQDETNNKDGMDIAICVIDKPKQVVEYAGAKNPLLYLQNHQLFEVKADKIPIGGDYKDNSERVFTNNLIQLIEAPTMFYLFTDGYQDQFGGDEGRKFGLKRMRTMFTEIHTQSIETQQHIVENTMLTWQQNEKQIDDVLIIGFSI